MTITQHAHIYSFHTSNFNFGEISILIFYQYSPYLEDFNFFVDLDLDGFLDKFAVSLELVDQRDLHFHLG
jgi:hypothetical protein